MKENINLLNTEQRNERTMHIDQMSTIEIIQTMNQEDRGVAEAIQQILPTIEVAIDAAYQAMKKGGRLIYVGAGTSGRLGILDASECPPTFGVDSTLIQGLIAGGIEALQVAKEGAEDSKELARQDLLSLQLNEHDIVCGLAASGRTPYVIGALEYANEIHATTLAVSCVHGAAISKVASYPIEAIVGAEVVTGSTRLKSGTAQKMVLNMLSTTLMIKMGKVYQNLMVDVKATNEKLVKRATNIIMMSTDCDEERAKQAMKDSGSNVKLAIIMILTNHSREEAERFLVQKEGNVANAIHTIIEASK